LQYIYIYTTIVFMDNFSLITFTLNECLASYSLCVITLIEAITYQSVITLGE